MAALTYSLCAMVALGCTTLLLIAYRRSRSRLLLWSGSCFAMLTVNNVLVAVDLLLFPEVSLFLLRNLAALAGVTLLLYGLVWESQ